MLGFQGGGRDYVGSWCKQNWWEGQRECQVPWRWQERRCTRGISASHRPFSLALASFLFLELLCGVNYSPSILLTSIFKCCSHSFPPLFQCHSMVLSLRWAALKAKQVNHLTFFWLRLLLFSCFHVLKKWTLYPFSLIKKMKEKTRNKNSK